MGKLAMKMKELLAGEITATTRTKAVTQRRRRQRSDRFTCWTCGQLGHFRRDCNSHTGSQQGRDEPQSRVSNTNHNITIIVVQSPITDIPLVEGSVGSLKCKMLVDTGAAVTLAAEEVMKGSKKRVALSWPLLTTMHSESSAHGPMCQGPFPSVPGRLGFYAVSRLHPGPGRKLIPFTKPIAVAPVGTKSANSRSQILVAMEQMLPKEQEAGGKYRPTLSAILEQFSDVLA
ncbi:hypothetical protein T03_11477, partial [Trichinella britovi]